MGPLSPRRGRPPAAGAGRAEGLTRRELVLLGGGAALALALAACSRGDPDDAGRFGRLVDDPAGVLDLPPGFSYTVLSPEGAPLRGGGRVPGLHDGMGAFPWDAGGTVLVRNHELVAEDGHEPVGARPFDPDEPGCTTAVAVDAAGREVETFVASSGTRRNCSGGVTPWGTWLTCEEDVEPGHGWVFEVDPRDPEGELTRRPIEAMGRFSHEALAVDPATGDVYLTEDDLGGARSPDGPVSFFYRYLPDDRSGRRGSLHAGGRLEALAADVPEPGGPAVAARWLSVDPASAHDAALAAGGFPFVRLEGCCLAGGDVWFADTQGGRGALGQIFRYRPGDGHLQLAYESTERGAMEQPDNLAAAPWGDLVAVEDGPGENRVLLVEPAGRVATFARLHDGELSGPCFSPDRRTLYVNRYSPGATLAVRGPFPSGRRATQTVSSPPA